MNQVAHDRQAQFLGHPAGLFVLFFAEMWERFSYYGMRALLVFYMTKGFLSYKDDRAYAVYGAYTALVYMTPFFGGLLADRLLGARITVIIGGVLMALGHLVMTQENTLLFYCALALIIAGNGFFKPNISAIVGQLYPATSKKRDGGFTIFYMGVNLGAAMSPLLCGYVGERYGWHNGFGLATIGMMIGLAVFVMPNRVTQFLIGAGALASCLGLIFFVPDNSYAIAVNALVAIALFSAAVISVIAIERGGLPDEAGRPPVDSQTLRKGLLSVTAGTIVSIPLLALFVSSFSIATKDSQPVQLISSETIKSITEGMGSMGSVAQVFLNEISKPAGVLLVCTGIVAFGYLIVETFRLHKIARERMFVVLILTFFSMLFWSFFEQAGSSLNNFTDRNVDRVAEQSVVTKDQVGTTIQLQPTQEQLGYTNDDVLFTMTDLVRLRKENGDNPEFEIEWVVHEDNVGMGLAPRSRELPASIFQAVNPIFILLFGLLFTALWTFLANRGIEPSTPYKFSLGLLQLGLGFGAFWLGTQTADPRGMVVAGWLILGYMLHTTGELCLSPVGLSMITRLSPKILVSTVMGGWFLATAFSQYLAAIISQFTGVSHGGGKEAVIPAPIETVHVYGTVFRQLAIAAIASGVICLVLAPLLKKWMHEGVDDDGEAQEGQ